MFGGIALNPIYGPPKPVVGSWRCTQCDVRWLGDGECWSCGSSDYLFQYLPAGWWGFALMATGDAEHHSIS